ncbi:hypothetical protein J6590_052332 [Homalodisca vitripennis]|nr:hypothetical protein J6590_052332 [Homalodisca vitripennis]
MDRDSRLTLLFSRASIPQDIAGIIVFPPGRGRHHPKSLISDDEINRYLAVCLDDLGNPFPLSGRGFQSAVGNERNEGQNERVLPCVVTITRQGDQSATAVRMHVIAGDYSEEAAGKVDFLSFRI